MVFTWTSLLDAVGLFSETICFISDAKVWVSDGVGPVIFSVLTRTSHRGISCNFSALALLVSGTRFGAWLVAILFPNV